MYKTREAVRVAAQAAAVVQSLENREVQEARVRTAFPKEALPTWENGGR